MSYYESAEGYTISKARTMFELYREKMAERKEAALAGEFDHTLTFMQRAHYMQTGECVALLP